MFSVRPDRERHFKISYMKWFTTEMEKKAEFQYINDNGEFVNYDALNETVDWGHLSSLFLIHTTTDGHVTLIPKDQPLLPTTLRLAFNDSCWYFSRGLAEKLGHLYNCLQKVSLPNVSV